MPAVRLSSELSRFRAISDRYLEEFFRLFPQDASELGLHQHDGSLGDNGPAVHLEYERLCVETAREVEALADSAFTGDDWLDRRGFLALLRTHLYAGRRGTWRTDPQLHSGAAVNSIFNLIVRNSERLAGALVNIHSRLEALPRFLAQGASCLRKPVPLWTKLAVQSCQGAETFLVEAGRELAAISPDPAKTERLFKEAAAAFKKYARAVAAKEPGPADGYSIGREGFEFLVRERTGLPYSCVETRAVGERLVAQLNADLSEEVGRFGKKKAGAVIEAAAARWQPEGTLLEEYQRVNGAVKTAFQEANLVTFPE